MGKRRNTAKTGDKALYKSRQDASSSIYKDSDDEDAMYGAVDRFHNRREQQEFLKLDAGSSSSSDEEDDGISGREGVLNLDGGEESSSSDSDDDDDSVNDELAVAKRKRQALAESSSDDDDDDDSSDEDDNELQQTNVRDWGNKKSSYYHGDTADLEIGQDEEDAFLEEEAAQQVQEARYERMDEDDFMLSDDDEQENPMQTKDSVKSIDMSATRDLSKLSKSDRRKLLQSHHPELLPLVSHFRNVVEEWNDRTSVVAKAVLEGDEGTIEAIGATPSGIQYITSKALLQSSTALNVAMYLLLKSEQATASSQMDNDDETDLMDTTSAIDSHPVLARLQQLNKLAQKLQERVETKVDTLSEQMDNLVKANELMNEEGSGESDTDEKQDEESVEEADLEVKAMVESTTNKRAEQRASEIPTASSSSSSEDEDDEEEFAASVMNDARFGLRAQELSTHQQDGKAKRRSRRAVPLDYGDDEDVGLSASASLSLASTVNAIEQRSATKSRKKRSALSTEGLDGEQDDGNDSLRQGLAMMEAELGRLDSGEEGDVNTGIDPELEEDPDEDDFYKSVKERSRAKKKRKAEMYAVAPKYPGMDQEIQGERAISKTIMKNRGLVAHKSKLNRNPRVKKREQYRKALVRRKGHVREVRTDEGHKYGGEETGIKSGLSRSRKLGTR